MTQAADPQRSDPSLTGVKRVDPSGVGGFWRRYLAKAGTAPPVVGGGRRTLFYAALSNLSLTRKVALIPALTMLLMGLMLALAMQMGGRQTAALRTLDRDVFDPLSNAQTLQDKITLLHSRMFALLSLGTNEADQSAQKADAEALILRLDATAADFVHFLDTTAVLPPATAARLSLAFSAYAAAVRQTASFAAYDASYGALLVGVAHNDFLTLRADLDALVQSLAQRRAALTTEAVANSVSARQRLLGLGVGSSLLALLGSIIVGRSVARSVVRLTALMNQLAGGDTDLTVSGAARRDEVGAMARAVEVFRANMIARRQGEVALHASNIQLDAALNSMLQGMMVWDPNCRVQLVNRRYFALCGMPADSIGPGMAAREVVDASVRHGLYPGEDPAHVSNMVTTLLTAQRSTQIEMSLRPGLFVRIASEPMADGGAVVTFEDMTEKRRKEEQISFMARHDALTGLANRTLFQEHMEAAVAQLDDGHQFAVLCLDLDRFKEVNDTLGHAAGDDLLRLVADRLRHCVREHDLIARLGGDEFAIVLDGTFEDSALVTGVAAPARGDHRRTL